MYIYDMRGPVFVHLPTLISESEELDLAVFTAPGIKEFNLHGKEFLKNLNWPCQPAQEYEIVVGGGYPGNMRTFENGVWNYRMLIWAHMRSVISSTGTQLLLNGQPDKGDLTDFSSGPLSVPELPGISGAPLFVLRDTLVWVGIVKNGCGDPRKGYTILATPSGYVSPDGSIREPWL